MSTDPDNPMIPKSYRVKRVRRETGNTVTLDLEPKSRRPAFSFLPGQFNMLYIPGVGEVPISISGDPLNPEPVVHTVRDVGAVTRAICTLRVGESVGLRGPFGTPWPTEACSGSDVLVLAGGIGLAPLRPAIHELLSHRERFGKVVILYGARTPDDMLYRRQLEQWRARFDVDVEVTVDRAYAGWKANVGVITSLIPRAPFDPTNTVAMVCGPEIMMRFAIRELLTRGVPAEQIYLSMERNMKCGVGLCGHCQYGPHFVCKTGPVFCYKDIHALLAIREN